MLLSHATSSLSFAFGWFLMKSACMQIREQKTENKTRIAAVEGSWDKQSQNPSAFKCVPKKKPKLLKWKVVAEGEKLRWIFIGWWIFLTPISVAPRKHVLPGLVFSVCHLTSKGPTAPSCLFFPSNANRADFNDNLHFAIVLQYIFSPFLLCSYYT